MFDRLLQKQLILCLKCKYFLNYISRRKLKKCIVSDVDIYDVPIHI